MNVIKILQPLHFNVFLHCIANPNRIIFFQINMAYKIDDFDFIENNFEKVISVESDEFLPEDYDLIEIFPDYEMLALLQKETEISYPTDPNNLYWTKISKRKSFLKTFKVKRKSYMVIAHDKFVNFKVFDKISKEYETFIDKIIKEDNQYPLINGDEIKSDCLALYFTRVLKMLGFIVKKKPRTEKQNIRFRDTFVQTMFKKAYETEDDYFYLIYSRKLEKENEFEMVVLDDYIFNIIIEKLNKTIEKLPFINYSTRKDVINFPYCFKVVYTTYTLLWDFVNHFSAPSKNFIFN